LEGFDFHTNALDLPKAVFDLALSSLKEKNENSLAINLI